MKVKTCFCDAIRQPDGLQNYCNPCNQTHTRIGYWYRKLSQVPIDAPDEVVEPILFRAYNSLPEQEVLGIVDRWLSQRGVELPKPPV